MKFKKKMFFYFYLAINIVKFNCDLRLIIINKITGLINVKIKN